MHITSGLSSIEASIPAGRDSLDRLGLPFGSYRVVASQRVGSRTLVSERPDEVRLTPEGPEGALELRLAENLSSVSVFTTNGRALPDVAIRQASHGPALTLAGQPPRLEAAPRRGTTSSLSAFPPGTPVIIVPPLPYVPGCRVTPFNEDVRVTVQAGVQVDVEFSRRGIRALSFQTGSFAGVSGSDCAIPLSAFSSQPVEGAGDRSLFRFSNFPANHGIEWECPVPPPFRQPVPVAAGGTVLLRYPSAGGRFD